MNRQFRKTQLDLRRLLRLDGRSGAIGLFFRWWGAELAELLPGSVRAWMTPRRATLILTVNDNHAAVARETNGSESVLGTIDLSPADPAAAAIRLSNLLLRSKGVRGSRVRRRGNGVRVRIAEREALRSRVTLPFAAEENLDEVVGFELDRWTPYRIQEVYLSHRIEERNQAAGTFALALTVVPRRTVDHAVAAVARLGLAIEGVEVARPAGDGPHDIMLRPQRSQSRFMAAATRAAAALLVFGFIGATAFYLVHEAQATESLRHEIEDGRRTVVEAQLLKEEIARLEEERDNLALRTKQVVYANDLLYQLTELLPDDTWLVRLRLVAGKVVLSCYSMSSAQVIRLLGESSLFHLPTFSSPVVQDPGTGREQFEITANVGGPA